MSFPRKPPFWNSKVLTFREMNVSQLNRTDVCRLWKFVTEWIGARVYIGWSAAAAGREKLHDFCKVPVTLCLVRFPSNFDKNSLRIYSFEWDPLQPHPITPSPTGTTLVTPSTPVFRPYFEFVSCPTATIQLRWSWNLISRCVRWFSIQRCIICLYSTNFNFYPLITPARKLKVPEKS